MPEQTVTYPFSIGQEVRVKKTGKIKTVTQLTANYVSDDITSLLIVCEANAVDYPHLPDDLEALPITVFEVLDELRGFTMATMKIHGDLPVGLVLAKIEWLANKAGDP